MADGNTREAKLTILESRAERYRKRIEECGTREELCELFKLIISARMHEREFSELYAATVRRSAWLKKEASR